MKNEKVPKLATTKSDGNKPKKRKQQEHSQVCIEKPVRPLYAAS